MNDDAKRLLETLGGPMFPRKVHIPGIGDIVVSKDSPLPGAYQELVKLDERQSFWSRKKWPADAFGKVFLARAVLLVGNAMFPSEWTGEEPAVNLDIAEIPDWLTSFGSTEASRRRYEIEASNLLGPRAKSRPGSIISGTDYEMARRYRRAAIDALTPARDRLTKTKKRLVDAFLAGTVSSCLLPLEGGEFSRPLAPSDWNAFDNSPRFYWCQMNPVKRFGEAIGGDGFQWIFVEGSGLEKMIADIKSARKTSNKARAQIRDEFFGVLLSAVIASPDENPRTDAGVVMGRDYWEATARSEYGLTRETFDEVWAKALGMVPNKWQRPGARKRNSRSG